MTERAVTSPEDEPWMQTLPSRQVAEAIAADLHGPKKRTRKGRVTEAGIAQRVETLRKQGWLCIPPRTPLLTRLMLALRG